MADEEPTEKATLDKLLGQIGLSSEFAQKVRFRGPVGKLALVAALCVVCLGAVAIKSSSPTVQGMCAVLAVIVALAIAGAILWYSHKHPEQATLEGMEVVMMHQQKMWAAAKGVPLIKSSDPPVPNPESADGATSP